MAVTHSCKLIITIEAGGDAIEIPATISCTIRPGTPDSWEEPGDAPEIEIEEITISVDGPYDKEKSAYPKIDVPAPTWLHDFIANSDGVYQYLGDASDWGRDDGPDPDDEYERLRDERGNP